MISGIKTFSSKQSAGYGGSATHHYYSSSPSAASKTECDVNGKFGPYYTEEQRKMYDAYLCRLDPKSQFSKTMLQQTQTRSLPLVEIPPKTEQTIKPPITEAERQRIRDRYDEKEKERHIRMYEQAVSMAVEREREEGRRFRSQRMIKFHVHYGTYVRHHRL